MEPIHSQKKWKLPPTIIVILIRQTNVHMTDHGNHTQTAYSCCLVFNCWRTLVIPCEILKDHGFCDSTSNDTANKLEQLYDHCFSSAYKTPCYPKILFKHFFIAVIFCFRWSNRHMSSNNHCKTKCVTTLSWTDYEWFGFKWYRVL